MVVFPTLWDARQLAACPALRGRYETVFAEPTSEDCPKDFDALGFIEALVAGQQAAAPSARLHGVTSSSDYPGATVAAALAQRLGLAGATPQAVIMASHKFASRQVQRRAVPEATPDFRLVDPRRADGGLGPEGFPWFVKPVKGAFSLLASRIDDPTALVAYLADPAVQGYLDDYVPIFNTLVRAFTDLEHDGSYFIAEELVRGSQVTVEGYLVGDEPVLLGVVDSILDPATGSFLRFDYPSCLPDAVQLSMVDITFRAVVALGLRDTLFNVELVHDAASGRMSILEVNPRMCGQFADLYEKVDGVNGYEVALALAVGERPRRLVREGRFAAAASFPLRVFEPVRVAKAPADRELRSAEARVPGTLVWTECSEGQELADFRAAEDGHSSRYAIVNLGGESAVALAGRLDVVQGALGYVFEPLGVRDADGSRHDADAGTRDAGGSAPEADGGKREAAP